jgi:cation transport regulator ChaB
MPFKANKDLPKTIRDVLPAAAQSVFRGVANSQLDAGKSEEQAFASAWSVVKQNWKKPTTGKVWVKKGVEKMSNIQMTAEITKSDDDKQLVYAWASVITKNGKPVEDSQEDIISIEELEQCARDFVVNCREAGEMHVKTTGVGKVVESMVFSKSMQDALGIDLGQEGWFVVMKIDDDEVWQKIKKGEYKMLSIGGSGERV